ncbi:MAG: TetR/AcrR family transcriptional regulator [Leucobacter sp.]
MSRGRPRSEASRQAILEAARALTREVGYEKVTVEAIARRAGVGKQTVYRWWPSKAEVVAEAVIDGSMARFPEAVPDTGDLRADLQAWLRDWIAQFTTVEAMSVMLALTVASSESQRVADEQYARFTDPHERLLRDRLDRAVEQGSLRSGADTATAAAAIAGTLVYRSLARQRELTVEEASSLVDLLLDGLEPR